MNIEALNSKYSAYPEYKDSGMEWLDVIPSDWVVSKVKYLAPFQVGWTPPTKVDANFIGDNLWANISDLKGRYIKKTAILFFVNILIYFQDYCSPNSVARICLIFCQFYIYWIPINTQAFRH